MESIGLKINGNNVWLVLEPLCFFENKRLNESNKFICYYNYFVPITIPYGEIVMNENGSPAVFTNKQEAELYVINYLKNKVIVK